MCLRLVICSEGLMYIICYDFTSESHLFAFVILFAFTKLCLEARGLEPALATLFLSCCRKKQRIIFYSSTGTILL